ncbi:hypothetical protein OSI26_21225, partial [Mycobacterium ulcerans]
MCLVRLRGSVQAHIAEKLTTRAAVAAEPAKDASSAITAVAHQFCVAALTVASRTQVTAATGVATSTAVTDCTACAAVAASATAAESTDSAGPAHPTVADDTNSITTVAAVASGTSQTNAAVAAETTVPDQLAADSAIPAGQTRLGGDVIATGSTCATVAKQPECVAARAASRSISSNDAVAAVAAISGQVAAIPATGTGTA